MDGLRWLLLLVGVFVVAGVYLYSRRERSKVDAGAGAEEKGRIAPTLNDRGTIEDDTSPENGDASSTAASAVETADLPQKIVTLRLVARDRGFFRGDDLVLNLRGLGMRHGKFGIFHCHDGSDEKSTIFSAASLVEPGSFDMTNIKEQEIPGISLFLILPGPIEGAEAFDMMMGAARTLAESLDGDLLDETGSNLSIQRERYMREEVIKFQHSILVA